MASTNPYETPQSDLAASTAGGVDETGPFDPKGRFSRLSYIAWAMLASIVINVVQFVVSLVLVGAGAAGSSDAAVAAGGADDRLAQALLRRPMPIRGVNRQGPRFPG
jgi:hypothetical protein